LKTDYFYMWFLYKSESCISCFRNDGEMKVSKVHRTCHSINGGSLEITHLFHLSIITSCTNLSYAPYNAIALVNVDHCLVHYILFVDVLFNL